MPGDQPDAAYLVPFSVDVDGARVRVANVSQETLHWVRVTVSGAPAYTALAPGSMAPGQVVELRVSRGAARAGHLQLAWLRDDGSGPYVWRSGL